ncbi:MAG: trigger factor [Gemmatimonadota bacterium]|nr:MAG: trigger factor [Gemmatimonadota bacterium]
MSQTTVDLQISIEEPAAWSRKLVITVPAGRVKSARAKVARNLAKRVRLPGFRKGKVPVDRLEARLGPEIDRQTQQHVIDEAFREAIQAKGLEPINEPRVANISYDRESEMTFEVSFDIRPQIHLARLGGFRLRRPAISVSDEDVEAQLGLLRRQQALWKRVERRPVAGDSVEVEIVSLDAEPKTQQAQPYRFVLGEGQAIPDVEAAIMTLSPESTEEFEVTFPADFENEERRGSRQRLRISLRQVLEQELPPLDDGFAGSVGDFEDLASLRQVIAEDLRRHQEQEIESSLNQQLIDQIIEANPFEVPDSMVDRYVDAMLGPPPEEADPDLVEKARQEARPAAVWGIKRTLVLQRVAQGQGIEATREEVQDRLQAIAKAAGKPLGEVRSRLAKSGEIRELERRITEEKVFRYLREQSEPVEGEA